MQSVLLDTNLVSYLMRGDPRAELYRPHLERKTLAISFMTVAELYEGAYRSGWGENRLTRLESQIRNYVVVPFSNRMCRIWGQIRAGRRQQPISVDDAWIAATALAHGCPLATHNPADFADIPNLAIITEHRT